MPDYKSARHFSTHASAIETASRSQTHESLCLNRLSDRARPFLSAFLQLVSGSSFHRHGAALALG
jgi:hypothetical protein